MSERMSDEEFRRNFGGQDATELYEEAKRARQAEKDLKEECQLRWDEGESAIQECSKLKYDIKCLEESTVDRKAWDKICSDKVDLMFHITKLEKENAELKFYIKELIGETEKQLRDF